MYFQKHIQVEIVCNCCTSHNRFTGCAFGGWVALARWLNACAAMWREKIMGSLRILRLWLPEYQCRSDGSSRRLEFFQIHFFPDTSHNRVLETIVCRFLHDWTHNGIKYKAFRHQQFWKHGNTNVKPAAFCIHYYSSNKTLYFTRASHSWNKLCFIRLVARIQ